ncbi:Lcd1p [Lachancea thermotolerans CBS 6340]|uniref:KLTH0F01936p n=1 Tax=Lachancea thermotolerans (strain ATCC 56472 / CBS 6340 / NRRL Y-8284) TaxID=559295 RepID=C5DK56_LACTC|nr:KLTH0F01936p [Lachancea thermotolerans CBS 6340]CAR23857.1 KLTH0F01936p [Lachancea thermotolerans CBS 6340]
MDDWDDDDEDDLIEALSKKPPREPSFGSTQSFQRTQNDPKGTETQSAVAVSAEEAKDIEMKLLKAQGEASMLRDKLALFEAEKERERKTQTQKQKELELQHQHELDLIKADLQKAEDEKKFLAFSGRSSHRSPGRHAAANTPEASSGESVSAATKKRKLEEPPRRYITLKPNRIVSDEVDLFVNSAISHRLAGSRLSTLEILNNIYLGHVKDFKFKILDIAGDGPVGKGIFDMLMSHIRSPLKLDQFIEILLECLAMLIKEISQHEKECDTAVPFLVALMHHCITFRPSAIHTMALKDLFNFMVDLIRTHRSVLKRPLRKSDLELDVGPDIFQYEFIRILTVLYAFDVLEDGLKIVQSLPVSFQAAFMDDAFRGAVDDISRYSLTISYQPVINVIHNTVEMFNCIANMLLEAPELKEKVPVRWWDNIINRLYHILNKGTSNTARNELELSTLHLFDEINIFGLIRNIGDNHNGQLISLLVKENEPWHLPRVIMRDFPKEQGITNRATDVEWWAVNMKIGIVKLFEKLAIAYRDGPVERNMLKVLARLLAQTQEVLLTVLLGEDSENIHVYYEFFSQTLKLIYHMWKSGQWELRLLREAEAELTVCLWRVVFGTTHEGSRVEMAEHKTLADRFDELRLQQDAELYEDAFENEVPDFVAEETRAQSFSRLKEIMGIGAEETTRQMAKTMLEGITSMEDADALYMAMQAGSAELGP